MSSFKAFAFLSALGALLLSGCGAKPAMEGAKSDSSEYGSVTTDENGPTGKGDSTSFESVEKVDEITVQRGDNLWNIAAKKSVYGTGWLYPLIVKANKALISNTKDLKIGITLKVPRGLPQSEYDIAREEAMAGTFDSAAGSVTGTAGALSYTSAVSPPQAPSQDRPLPKKGHGSGWILWLLAALLAAALGWLAFKMRRGEKPE